MIAIINYGMGNLRSVEKALQSLGAACIVTDAAEDIRRADRLVLPGVGAFGDAVAELKRRGLFELLADCIRQGKIFLGLCLGMQLLFAESEEAPACRGLAVLPGTVRRFSPQERELKIPHMGWNQVALRPCPLFAGVKSGAYMYFVHSYYVETDEAEIVAATTDYGVTFTSAIRRGSIYALQFHPEKSQQQGLQILKNFINIGGST